MTRGRLFRCLYCGLEANRDAVGVLNIGHLHGGGVNWVVAHPLLLRWDGMRWEPKRAVKNRPMITPEARISRLQPWRVSRAVTIVGAELPIGEEVNVRLLRVKDNILVATLSN
jgi:hypothetical protein